LRSQLTATYMVSDRWFATAFVAQDRVVAKDAKQDLVLDDHWLVGYGASANYYLEDRLVLSATVAEDQYHQTGPYTGFSGGYRQARVALSLSYRILGRFEAPGIIPAQGLPVPR